MARTALRLLTGSTKKMLLKEPCNFLVYGYKAACVSKLQVLRNCGDSVLRSPVLLAKIRITFMVILQSQPLTITRRSKPFVYGNENLVGEIKLSSESNSANESIYSRVLWRLYTVPDMTYRKLLDRPIRSRSHIVRWARVAQSSSSGCPSSVARFANN